MMFLIQSQQGGAQQRHFPQMEWALRFVFDQTFRTATMESALPEMTFEGNRLVQIALHPYVGPDTQPNFLDPATDELLIALDPALWVSLFTADPGVTAAAHSYFHWAGPAFAFFGMGVSLYFSSQGAARVGGPVLASTARLLIVAIGGIGLMMAQAPAWTLFALVGGAMIVFGLSTAASVAFARWGK